MDGISITSRKRFSKPRHARCIWQHALNMLKFPRRREFCSRELRELALRVIRRKWRRDCSMITVVDYKLNNLRSIENTLRRLGHEVRVTSNPEDVRTRRS